ncbi:MAG: hypothetical protein RL020_1361 [Pseudomonadota bacterium]|jgi:DNA-binding transcriptional regulator YiaG
MTTKITTAKQKSYAFAAIHSPAQGLKRAGIISKTNLREYDVLCLNKRK